MTATRSDWCTVASINLARICFILVDYFTSLQLRFDLSNNTVELGEGNKHQALFGFLLETFRTLFLAEAFLLRAFLGGVFFLFGVVDLLP